MYKSDSVFASFLLVSNKTAPDIFAPNPPRTRIVFIYQTCAAAQLHAFRFELVQLRDRIIVSTRIPINGRGLRT
jgi:hypothetical protein